MISMFDVRNSSVTRPAEIAEACDGGALNLHSEKIDQRKMLWQMSCGNIANEENEETLPIV